MENLAHFNEEAISGALLKEESSVGGGISYLHDSGVNDHTGIIVGPSPGTLAGTGLSACPTPSTAAHLGHKFWKITVALLPLIYTLANVTISQTPTILMHTDNIWSHSKSWHSSAARPISARICILLHRNNFELVFWATFCPKTLGFRC